VTAPPLRVVDAPPMPLQKLSDAVRSREAASPSLDAVCPVLPSEAAAGPRQGQLQQAQESEKAPRAAKVYRWIEFGNKEQTTEFDEAHFCLEGFFESNSSVGHKEFQDRLRAIHFRKEGKARAEIAGLLGRSEKFVSRWWQKEEKEVPRPWGVHEYLSKEMGQKTFNQQASLSEGAPTSTASWWRDVELRRRYHADPAIYEEILQNTEWAQGAARTRDFSTGASHLKYDKEGNLKKQGNQSAKYTRGSSPAFEKLLQKFFAEYGIADRTSGIGLNWYPDGGGVLGSHRHDCWTALFSFGHERILTIDKTPLLLQDSDLVIFGTQRHGVPLMPQVTGGRITVPIFFYPDHLQMKKQWQTLTDPDDPRASRELVKLEKDHALGAAIAGEETFWEDPGRAASLAGLVELGFQRDAARAALRGSAFDADGAVELLLLAGAGPQAEAVFVMDGAEGEAGPLPLASRASRCRFNRRGAPSVAEAQLEATPASASSSSSAPPRAKAGPDSDADSALALQLQMDEERCWSAFGAPPAGRGLNGLAEESDAGLAAQLEDEERTMLELSQDLLQEQFHEYEEQFKREAAEDWHGHGDLMQSGLARETLSLESMDKVACYSVGHGRLSEKHFYELLQLSSVRVLYDFRASDNRGDVHAPCPHFAVRALRSACRSRGISYKHIALGRESAYGILKHVQSDEAKHALIELAWHAKRSRSAFLGFEPDWRLDHRQVIADKLVNAGHTVLHIDGTGATEEHESNGRSYPDFILREEEKLRRLEKMRQAGELKKLEKSAVDRSTESIASKLSHPSETVDSMDELRAARNQVELVQAQRNLARIQRLGAKHGELAKKVLVGGTPQWIFEEAREQEAWVAKKKAESAERTSRKALATLGGSREAEAEAAEVGEDPEVECASCSSRLPWSQLVLHDGRCSTCNVRDGTGQEARAEDDDEAAAAEALQVECASCSLTLPWRILRLQDGLCPQCSASSASASGPTPLQPSLPALPAEAQSFACEPEEVGQLGSGSWRARRRRAAAAACG